ncbi:phage tail tape measure protein [Shinella sp. PSBB067]|uniref:phage tail tape measure protein n=1 Tax=Shinella sp. PSBB067 TaxID=2715959 RepID=UPI00193BA2DC|nr:phage tail tape measure protein [Shinella sp. PSBB067]QRI61823.1 phage tail tape measure protein [Shinella sp. PSBB067]
MSTLTSSLVVRLIDQVTAPARAVTKSLLGLNKATGGNFGDRLRTAIDNNNAALDRARGGMVDAVAGFYLLKQALGAPIKNAMDFESAMADIAKVSGFDTKGLDEYGKRLRKLAVTEIPLAVNDLAALSAAAAQAGVPDEDLFDFTRLVAKAAVAWEMSGAEAGEALAKIRTALGLTNEQTAAYADAVNFVSDATAASSRDLIDFTKRVASQGEFYGFAKEQTLAFGAAMISAGAESEVAATSFRNMGRALTKGASATKSQRTAWKTLGMDAKKVAKAMQKDAVGTTLKVVEKLGQLPEHMQASVMSNLFGDEARALAPLLNNVDLLRNALALTADEQKYLNSVGKEFEKRAATSAYKLQRFKSQLGDIALTIGGALLPALNKLLVPLGEIALKFSAWTEANPELVRNIVIATSAIVGFRVALAGLRFVGLLGRGGVLSMLALGFNTVGRAAIGASRAVKSAVGLQAALGAMSGMKLTGIQTVTTALKAMALAVPGVSAISGALSAVGAALAAISAPAWGLIAVGVAAVAAAGALMWRYWDRITSVVSGVASAIGEQLQPVFDALGPVLEPVKTTITAIGDAFSYLGEKISAAAGWFGSFFEKEVLSESDKAKLEQSAYEVTTRIAEAIKLGTKALYDAGSQLIQSLWDGMMSKIDALIEWVKTIPSRIRAAIGRIDLSNMISLGGLFGGGGETGGGEQVSGHRKSGGPVARGGSYVVGEEEPEIFTPTTGGTITPMSQAGRDSGPPTSVVINVNGATDPHETARIVEEKLRSLLRGSMRGVHADLEAR